MQPAQLCQRGRQCRPLVTTEGGNDLIHLVHGQGFALRFLCPFRLHGLVSLFGFAENHAIARLTAQGICSYFVPMAQPIDTLGKAVRRGMLVKAYCNRCGNARLYRASDLMMIYGGGRDPLALKFRCKACEPDISITLVDVDLDRARGAIIHEPLIEDGKAVAWTINRLK